MRAIHINVTALIGIVGSVLVLANAWAMYANLDPYVLQLIFEAPMVVTAVASAVLCSACWILWGLSSARWWALLVLALAIYSLLMVGDYWVADPYYGFMLSAAGTVVIAASMVLTIVGVSPVVSVGGEGR